MDVYGGLAGAQGTAASIYGGSSPTLQGYKNLQGAAANDPSIGLLSKYAQGSDNPASGLLSKFAAGGNDPSMGTLGQLAQGSHSPGSYDGIGSELSGMTNQQVNGDTSQFYKDTLSRQVPEQQPVYRQDGAAVEDAALKSVNQRFAASGMGEGMSTPYAFGGGLQRGRCEQHAALHAYNNELNRMGRSAGSRTACITPRRTARLALQRRSDSSSLALSRRDASFSSDRNAQLAAAQSLGSQYTSGQKTGLDAATTLGSQYLTGQGQQIGAAQGLGSQYSADNATSLAATNGMSQAQIAALAQATGLSAAQLAALQTSGQLPYTGLNAYAGDMNSLIGKYGTNTGSGTSTETSKGSIMDYLLQMQNNAAKAAAAGEVKSHGIFGNNRRTMSAAQQVAAGGDGVDPNTVPHGDPRNRVFGDGSIGGIVGGIGKVLSYGPFIGMAQEGMNRRRELDDSNMAYKAAMAKRASEPPASPLTIAHAMRPSGHGPTAPER
jgi:hypothetical protein